MNSVILAGLWTAAWPVIIALVTAGITVGVMQYLSKNKSKLSVVSSAIQILHMLFGDKLGNKANAIFDIWLDCLTKVQNGEWTEQEMLDEFFRIVSEVEKAELTEADKMQITDLTKASIKMFAENKVNIQSVR